MAARYTSASARRSIMEKSSHFTADHMGLLLRFVRNKKLFGLLPGGSIRSGFASMESSRVFVDV